MGEEQALIVDLDLRKWGGRPHYRHAAELLGSDEHGTWLGVRAGTPFTGPNGLGEMPGAFVLAVRDDAWWFPSFWEPGPGLDFEVYVDVTTLPRWLNDGHLTAIDLDLDVIRRVDGTVFLDDEDEFEEHLVLFGYPDVVIDKARTTARWLMDAVASEREPFGSASRRWMERLVETP
jgi:hypothetical protein